MRRRRRRKTIIYRRKFFTAGERDWRPAAHTPRLALALVTWCHHARRDITHVRVVRGGPARYTTLSCTVVVVVVVPVVSQKERENERRKKNPFALAAGPRTSRVIFHPIIRTAAAAAAAASHSGRALVALMERRAGSSGAYPVIDPRLARRTLIAFISRRIISSRPTKREIVTRRKIPPPVYRRTGDSAEFVFKL